MSEGGAFDPQATEEEAASRSQYFSLRDVRVIAVVIVLLAAMLYPIYLFGKARSEKSQCVNNFKAMFDAVGLYMKDHDDGLPPAYRADSRGLPEIGESGKPYGWASDINQYMVTRASFRCPSASPDEVVDLEDPRDSAKSLASTYGMYYALSTEKTFNIERPEDSILITETANQGARESFNPVPYKTETGEPIPDGFIIGWDDNNFHATPKSRYVTRLAFRGSASGNFEGLAGRHDDGIHALTMDGSRIILKSPDALIRREAGYPAGFWRTPARDKN